MYNFLIHIRLTKYKRFYNCGMKWILFLLITPVYLFSQDVAIGQWKDYLAYNQATDIAIADEKIYCVSQGGLFYYDTGDNSINRISKINGLSENGVKYIKYNDYNDILLIAYENCNIDIISNNQIINISEIKRKEINGIKTINNISFDKELAYISCSFGVVVLDLIKNETKDTYKIGNNGNFKEINQTTIINELIYVATSEGIYFADKTNLFLSDFNQWTQDTLFENSNLIYGSFSSICNLNGMAVSVINLEKDSILIKNGDLTTSKWEALFNVGLLKPKVHEKEFGIIIADSNRVLSIDENLMFNEITGLVNIFSADAINLNELWLADKTYGLMKYENGSLISSINVNSPISNDIYNLEYIDDKLFMCHGGHMNFSVNQLNNDGASYLQNEDWENIDFFDLGRARDIVAVATKNNKEYYASWYDGISEMNANNHIIKYGYNNTGGVLDTTFYSNNRIQVSDIKFDQSNNLWGLNSQVQKPLFVKTPSDNWFSFSMNLNIDGLYFDELIIDQMNYKWGIIYEKGVFVYNDNNTIENASDDEYKILNTSIGNGNLPSLKIRCIKMDLDGEIWLGSDKGISVFYSPELVFSGFNFDSQQILIQEGEYGQYLLSSEKINCIEVDGANRKWIGTESAGLYLLSNDGTDEIHHFTKENSPIFSNKIIDITINHENGEVFIGTDKGLMSYRSNATSGEVVQRETYVFPNPVRENYRGNIAINKLINNAFVKITDFNGELVYQTIANGGQANWDGNNFNNERVGSGVYLVFSTDENGYEKMVSKILFIK